MRIAVVISGMGAGGAERVVAGQVNWWARSGRRATLITLASRESDFYPLDSRVRRVGLDLLKDSRSASGALVNNLFRVKALGRALRRARPQVIVSHTDKTNVLTLLAAGRGRAPVLAVEHIDPSRYSIGPIWGRLRFHAYPRAAAIVGVTGAVVEYFQGRVGNARLLFIPNPIDPAPRPAPAERSWPPGPTIMAMGRLTRQKGFDLLIQALDRAGERLGGWQVVILGQGEEREALLSQAQSVGLSGRVHFLGRVERPEAYLCQADIFALPSRFEGFPMSLLEAMALGLPVAATDSSSGAREILNPGQDGLLVPPEDVPALAEALVCLAGDEALRQRLGGAASEVCGRFSFARVMARWDDLFAQVTEEV